MRTFVWHFRTDKNKLDEMLFLRGAGWSYTALAERYECPKLTIRFLARKYGLTGTVVQIQFRHQDYISATTAPPTESTIGITVPNEKVSQGKTYAQYLQEDKERRWKQLTQKQNVTT